MTLDTVVVLMFAMMWLVVVIVCLWALLVAYHIQLQLGRMERQIQSYGEQILDQRQRLERHAAIEVTTAATVEG
jgi:hypothetical protein